MNNDQPAFSALFVFGDSLSDNGAIFALTGGAFPPTALTGTDLAGNPVDFAARDILFNQRFTDGRTYAEYAADQLNIQGDTSTFYDNFRGSNLAVGGATATDLSAIGLTASNTYADQFGVFQQIIAGLPGGDTEVQSFLNSAAASIFLGLNDLGAIGGVATAGGGLDQGVIATGVGAIIQELFVRTQALVQTGIGTIILNTLPGGTWFPSNNALIAALGPDGGDIVDQVSASVNDGIKALAAQLAASGVNVSVVDFYSLAKEIQGDMESFGFLSLENLLPSSDPVTTLLIDDIPIDQVGFIDPVHFTDELHQIFGAFHAMTQGTTQIDGDDGRDILRGSSDSETIFARGGNDRVFSGNGHDLVFAGAGHDVVFAGGDDDVVFGGAGNDNLFGGAGNDIMGGGAGKDNVQGGAGDDVLAGNAGNDYLNGGAGNDVITDGLGNDVVLAGAGDDVVIYRAPGDIGGSDGTDRDIFNGGSGIDALLVVSETPIDDVLDFLMAQNVRAIGFETFLAVTAAELDAFPFPAVGHQVETADLFGVI